jgi:pyruvate dehydrogenase E1 component alpha subunit
MYKLMVLTRAYDNKILSLQRQGRTATFAPGFGEEAAQVGSASAMRPNDIFVPAFRQSGVYLTRGFPMDLYLLYWIGYEEGNVVPENVRGMPMAVPVSTQMPHAAGIAYAQKYKGSDSAVVAYVGDGGTSEGDFAEALNLAGVWKAPLVAIIQNNQWAISMPRKKQSAAETLAQKAFAAGINGVQVDGNDVVAVYKATREAISNARDGPTLIECVTYRMGMHTTSDDPTKYRSDEETAAWAKKDPILRVKAYLEGKGLLSDAIDKEIEEGNSKIIDSWVEKAESFKPDPTSMFTNVYSFMPEILSAELEESKASDFWQG